MPGLRVGAVDLRPQLVGELALLLDRGEDGGPPLFELAQVAQALVQRAQLRVVERAGDLLAVPGDKRDGRPAIEQLDGGGDLVAAHPELVGDPLDDAAGGRLGGQGLGRAGGGGLRSHGRVRPSWRSSYTGDASALAGVIRAGPRERH
jgi:hypothetical protein